MRVLLRAAAAGDDDDGIVDGAHEPPPEHGHIHVRPEHYHNARHRTHGDIVHSCINQSIADQIKPASSFMDA